MIEQDKAEQARIITEAVMKAMQTMQTPAEKPDGLSPSEALAKMKELPLDPGMEDPETNPQSDHKQGDAILCALLRHLGHGTVVDEWEKRAEGWWWA